MGVAVAGCTARAYGIKAYTAREWDPEINLYYYRARYYDPKVGRFISEDPIRGMGGINFYAYAAGQPTGATDPFGLQPVVPVSPPSGCTAAGPWELVETTHKTRFRPTWTKMPGPQVNIPNTTGGQGNRASTTFCLCYYVLSGAEKVTSTWHTYERPICCDGEKSTQTTVTEGPEEVVDWPVMTRNNPPPGKTTRTGLVLNGKCHCPAEPM